MKKDLTYPRAPLQLNIFLVHFCALHTCLCYIGLVFSYDLCVGRNLTKVFSRVRVYKGDERDGSDRRFFVFCHVFAIYRV